MPLKMGIKINRKKYGTEVEDFGETVNISREGAYFRTAQNYEVGENLQVVVPYKKGELAIPVFARVIRQDKSKGSFGNAVAIFMGSPKK